MKYNGLKLAADQFYGDMKALADLHPLDPASDYSVSLHDEYVDQAQADYPDDVDVTVLRHAEVGVSNRDLFLMAGRLNVVIPLAIGFSR